MVEIHVYDVIGKGFLEDGVTAEGVRSELEAAGGGEVTVRINSPGGSAFEGVAIKNLLDSYEGTVNIKIDGLAASAASVIALAGQSVEMADGAMLMIHDPWDVTVGNEADHNSAATALGKVADSLAGMYSRRGNQDTTTFRDLMKEETWLTAEEAIELGLADSTSEETMKACKVPPGFGYKNAPKQPFSKAKQPKDKKQYAVAIMERQSRLTKAKWKR